MKLCNLPFLLAEFFLCALTCLLQFVDLLLKPIVLTLEFIKPEHRVLIRLRLLVKLQTQLPLNSGQLCLSVAKLIASLRQLTFDLSLVLPQSLLGVTKLVYLALHLFTPFTELLFLF